MNPVFFLLGFMLAVLAVSMLFPIFIALALQENECTLIFLMSMGATAFIAGGLLFISRGCDRLIKRHEALLLAFSMWVVVPFFIAVPFFLSGFFRSGSEAYFEAVSGFTTTGVTLLAWAETYPSSFLFWRGLVDWLGGLAMLTSVLLFFSPAHGVLSARSPLFMGERKRFLIAHFGPIAWFLLLYAILTLFCFFALVISGLLPLEAIIFSFSAISTSGFMLSSSFYSYSVAVQCIFCFFLFLGATSIIWQYRLFIERSPEVMKYRFCHETCWFFLLIVSMGLIFCIIFYLDTSAGILSALGLGLSSALFLLSTGVPGTEAESLTLLPPFLLLFLITVGGSSFSTSGGIKVFRFGAMLLQARGELYRLIYPHGKQKLHVGERGHDLGALKPIWLVFFSFIAMSFLGNLALTAGGMDFTASLLAAVSSLANAGGLYANFAETMPSWPSYEEMGFSARLVLTCAMIAGRMEVIGILALYHVLSSRFRGVW